MSRYIEKVESEHLPVVVIRGMVPFPEIPISYEVFGSAAVAACKSAHESGSSIFIVAQKNIASGEISPEDLFKVGVVAKVDKLVEIPDGSGSVKILTKGYCRAYVDSYTEERGGLYASLTCKTLTLADGVGGVKGTAYITEIRDAVDTLREDLPNISVDFLIGLRLINDPGVICDYVSGYLLSDLSSKQKVLEELDPFKRCELLLYLLYKESDMLKAEAKIKAKVKARLDANQKDFYLKEQLKAIREELGYDGDEDDEEIVEYNRRIAEASLPDEVREKLLKEVKKLSKTPYASAESAIMRNYIDTCLEFPWNKTSKDRISVSDAKKVLDADHDGLEKVKERILEFIAVKQLNPELKNQIICLVGPPGTGKTSVGASIARALDRKYVRVSLGGVRDEADIRGHRRTYVASMPGRIVTALSQAGVMNPVVLLDEVDKLTRDNHGDPSSALLEVLDSEQNKSFRDHFIELPVDLSDCLFIATANDISNIPKPLLDRMEVIELKIYTRHEKLSIAKHHLIPKQLKRHGLDKKRVRVSDKAVLEIIDFYTSEAGVRNLERSLASLFRKAAKKIASGECEECRIKDTDIKDYLGNRKVIPDKVYDSDLVGVVNGLAYTEVGGDLLRIEAAAMPGNGKIELTGSLGEVMKESAHAAITYIRSHTEDLGISPDFYKTKDIHIHVPEGAVPKDGPSAGVTIATALVSELSGKPVRRDIAMTGEITLRGRVLAIGGLKEKTMAAYKAGVKTVCIPEDNMKDIPELDQVVKDNLSFLACKSVDQVFDAAILR